MVRRGGQQIPYRAQRIHPHGGIEADIDGRTGQAPEEGPPQGLRQLYGLQEPGHTEDNPGEDDQVCSQALGEQGQPRGCTAHQGAQISLSVIPYRHQEAQDREQGEGSEQAISVQEPGMPHQERLKGQQTHREECRPAVQEAPQQPIGRQQAQRGDEGNSDAPGGEEEGQMGERLAILGSQPGESTDPVEMRRALGRDQPSLNRQARAPQPHGGHARVSSGRH